MFDLAARETLIKSLRWLEKRITSLRSARNLEVPGRTLRFLAGALPLGFALASGGALAHKPSDAYMAINADQPALDIVFDVAVRDLDRAIPLDSNNDLQITWSEVRSRLGEINAQMLRNVTISSTDGPCRLSLFDTTNALAIDQRSDGSYVSLHYVATCGSLKSTPAKAVTLAYRWLFEQDPQHKLIVSFTQGGATSTTVIGAESGTRTLRAGTAGVGETIADFVRLGIHHIWTGWDHLLFVLTLLIPAVGVTTQVTAGSASRHGPAPQNQWRSVLWQIGKTVTAFTLAHSITLALAAFEIIQLPSRWVESGIALSIVIAAIAVALGHGRQLGVGLAFTFGLLHGFGFASALSETGLPQNAVALALFAFNLGVELGQLAVVALFVAVVWSWRETRAYRIGVARIGSALIILVALTWFAERAFAVSLL